MSQCFTLETIIRGNVTWSLETSRVWPVTLSPSTECTWQLRGEAWTRLLCDSCAQHRQIFFHEIFFTDIKILRLHPKYSTWPVEAVCLIPCDPPYYTDTQNNIWKCCFRYFLVHCSAFSQNNRLLPGNPAIYTLILPRVCFSFLLIWTEFEM